MSTVSLMNLSRKEGVYPYIGFKAKDVKNIKSSNPSVAVVKVKEKMPGYQDGDITLNLVAKKAGTTTVSFRLVNGKKSKQYKIKVTVTKCNFPYTTFTVGKQNFKSIIRKNDIEGLMSLKSGKAKVSVKTASDWKIVKETYDSKKDATVAKKIKNGSVQNFTGEELIVYVKHKKTGLMYTTRIS